MANGTDLKTYILAYGGDEVAEIADSAPQFLVWVGTAIVNRHEDVCVFMNKWTTDSFTFSAAGFENAVPTDWDRISTMILYTDSDHQNPYDGWRAEFGVHRFASQQSASKTFYRRYRLQPNEYTAMSTAIPEIADPRAKKIIAEETIAVYLAAQNDLETSNAEESAKAKANRNG